MLPEKENDESRKQMNLEEKFLKFIKVIRCKIMQYPLELLEEFL